MTRYTVDLRTKCILADQRIWRLFSGGSYTFLGAFISESVVFLDTPGLVLPDDMAEEPDFRLNQRVNVTHAVKLWAYDYYRSIRLGHTGELKERPSIRVDTYPRSVSNSLQALKFAVRSMFGEAKKGDLVVVPDQLRHRRVWIAEFLDAPNQVHNIRLPQYGTEAIPARRVHWFEPIDEGKLPTELSATLRSQNFFTLLGRQYRELVLGHSYGSYYSPDEYVALFATNAPDFEAPDGYHFNVLAMLASALFVSRSLQTMDEAIHATIPPQFRLSQSYNISSPGEIFVKASTPVPVVMAALFALFWASSTGAAPPDSSEVTIVNSLSDTTDDQCFAEVSDAVRRSLNIMGMKVWEEACRATRRLSEGARLSADPKVSVEPSPARRARRRSGQGEGP